jgi:hypothetical protein
LIVKGGGNVGIGSAWPGSALDIQGTTRTTGLQLSTGPSAGYVLVSNTVGVGTWMAGTTVPATATPGGSSPQLQYNNAGSFGGIANSAVNASGNVGLGTTLSANKLDIQGGVGIGTSYAGYFPAPTNGLIVEGNLGVGTSTPQTRLGILGGNVGIGTWTAQSVLQLRGSMGVQIVSKSSSYTATANDYFILVDASGGAVTITLPASSGITGRVYNIKKTDSSGNAVIIDPNSTETIDGLGTMSTTTQYQAFTVVCDGSNWWAL